MKFGAPTRIVLLPLALVFGLAASACNPLAAVFAPNRQIVLEADAEELARRAESGASIDMLMNKAIDVIDRRAVDISASDPVVRRSGQNRIILEISSDEDPEQLKRLLLSIGKLEIKLVDGSVSQDDIAAGKVPMGAEILPYPAGADFGRPAIAVRQLGGLVGQRVSGAQQNFDIQTDEPAVAIQFDEPGGAKFARLTKENVGQMLAIIYDGKVISAPVIREPIIGGMVQISGGLTVESAQELAIMLRSGRLPLRFELVEDKAIR